MSGTQASSQGQLTCDLLRALARVSSSIRAKRKRSLLDEWVSNLSQVELSDSCYEMSQGESWVEVKNILILHSVTSTSQRGTPVLLLLNSKGKLIQANDTTSSNCMFGLDMNPDVYKMKYYEKELMSNLWVTLKLNKCRGGDVSIEKSTDLVGLMKALSDGNCFTREPIHHKGHMIVPWLQELSRFTAGQYIVALLEKELWARWIRSRAEGTKATMCTASEGIYASAEAKSELEQKPATLARTEQNYSNVNIVQTAAESFTANDNDYHKPENTSSILSHPAVNGVKHESTRRGMAHELVQSFLEIVKTKDHEKLIFIIGTTQKRCTNGHNSMQAMKFYKKSIEAAKLWTIIYLLESQSAVSYSKRSYTTIASPATAEASAFSPGRVIHNITENPCDSIHGSRSVTRQIAESIVSIPLLESMTPFHELKAILCTRFLAIGANCFAEQLIQDEKNVSENSVKKCKKKKVKRKKSFAPESHRLGSKGTGEPIVTAPPHPVCVGASLPSLLNISISPHLLTPHLIERSEACIFIGRWVDELVDSATSLSNSLSPGSYSPTTSFATLSTDIDFSGNHDDIVVVEGLSVTAIECQLQRECEAETEHLLEEEFYFPRSPIDVDCTHEEEEDRDGDRLTTPSSEPHDYTDSDSIVRSTILTTSSRDSWSDMALFPRLHAYDSTKNIIGAEKEIQETNVSVTANLGANSYCPSSVAEIIKVVRSEEGEVEGEGGRGSPGYLTAPSDVFGGWAFDNISGGPHLGPYYSEGTGTPGGGGGGGGYAPYGGSSKNDAFHANTNMSATSDNTVPPPFNRFLILLPSHQNSVNMDHSAQNSDCDTSAHACVTPMPYKLQSSNAYQNNNWNNSWSNNWNNMGSENCYTYKCIYSLDDFADHKHSLMDNNEPSKDGSNSESNSENDSSGSKSANDGSNNNSNSNRCSSQLASWNYDQSLNGATAASADSDSAIAPLADRYCTQDQRSSLREVLRESARDDVSVTVHSNECTGATHVFEEASEHHECNNRTADSNGSKPRKSLEHVQVQEQDQDQDQEGGGEVHVKDSSAFMIASLPLIPSRGNLPLIPPKPPIPPCPSNLPPGAHGSVSQCNIPVTAVKGDLMSGIDAAAEVICRRYTTLSVEEVEELRDQEDYIEKCEVVTGDIISDSDRRELGRVECLDGPPSEEVAGILHVSATDSSTFSCKSDSAQVKDERATSGALHDLRRPEPGSALNLLPRQMLVRRSSAPKLTSSTPLSSTSSSSSSQRKGNAKVKQLKLQGIQHGKDLKKSHMPQQQQHQQHRLLSMNTSAASNLAANIPGTHVRRPFSSTEHTEAYQPVVNSQQDRGSATVSHPSSSIESCHEAAKQSAPSPTTCIQTKSDVVNLVVSDVCVTCTPDLPQDQKDSADVSTSIFDLKDDGKIINFSNESKQGRHDNIDKAVASVGNGCGNTPSVTDSLLALATSRSPPNTITHPHSSPNTARVSIPSSKTYSPGVSSPSTPGILAHPLHSQPLSPSTPPVLSDSSKILISSPRFPKGESPHSPLCGSRTVTQMQSPNADSQGDGRHMKDLLLMSLRCLRSESERALLLNQQAVQSAVIVGLQHRIFPLPIPLPLPTQNLPSRAHLPFPKSLNNEFPSKHTGFTAQHLPDDPRHGFNLKRHHTFDSRTERADSDGESGPMMHLSRGFHAIRSGSAYGRGHMGVNPNFPMGYGRGDASAAWEVMSDEGRGTGQFWQASRSRDCDDVYAHHHPAAIGLPYPPRPGSGSGLRPKPFIAKGPVLASDAVPEGEKRDFEAQAEGEGEKGGFEVQVAAVEVEVEVEVDDEGLRQEQGQGGKSSTSAATHVVRAGAGAGADQFPALHASTIKEPRPHIPQGRYASSMQHGPSNKKAQHTHTHTPPPVMSAPKSLVEVAHSLGLSADSVQSALSVEILEFVSTVDAQEANLRSVKSDAVDRMRAVVQGLWPRAQVKAFGSFVSGLSLPGSDLDMVICLPNVHTEAAPEAPGGLEGRNSIKESWQQSLARCLSKEEWVAAQSIKVIGNTAIPVVKLKTQILTPPPFSSQGCSSYYENESRHDHGSDRKKMSVRTSVITGAGVGAMSSGGCGGGVETDSGGGVGGGGGGGVLSLDISFEGPGHYGLEANKMTTSLIKAYAPLRPLVLVLKYFLTRKGLCEAFTGGLSSYALLLVTARFLQEVELQESFDLGALLLGVLNFFGDHFDPRVTGISVARRCYFSRAVQTGPQLYPHLARAPLIPPPSAPHVHLSVSVTGSGTHCEGGLKSDSSDNNSDSRGRGRGQLPSTEHYSFLSDMTHSQQLVIIPKAADRRHSFQANEQASSNPGRDRGRKYPPSASAGLQPTLSMPTSFSHPNTAHTSSGYSSYVPYKFDPLFVEDPLSPGNNVGRNCFRILQVQRSWSEVHSLMSQQIRVSARDGLYHSALEILVGKVNITSTITPQGYT